MWAGNLEVFASVIDFADESRIGVDARFAREFDSVGTPRAVPQLVDDIHIPMQVCQLELQVRERAPTFILLADCISFVMISLRLPVCEVASSRIKIARYDIPPNAVR